MTILDAYVCILQVPSFFLKDETTRDLPLNFIREGGKQNKKQISVGRWSQLSH